MLLLRGRGPDQGLCWKTIATSGAVRYCYRILANTSTATFRSVSRIFRPGQQFSSSATWVLGRVEEAGKGAVVLVVRVREAAWRVPRSFAWLSWAFRGAVVADRAWGDFRPTDKENAGAERGGANRRRPAQGARGALARAWSQATSRAATEAIPRRICRATAMSVKRRRADSFMLRRWKQARRMWAMAWPRTSWRLARTGPTGAPRTSSGR